MPFIEIESKSQGLARINYIISTPTSDSAQSIDENVPTLLLFHPVYIGITCFHPQLSDPQLRRFNLVALDFRAHGETGGVVTSSYGQEEAAEDVVKFMDALKLKKCYFVAISMGTIIALQVAIWHPERVLGMFLMSPLGLEELPDVADGRQQIYDTWVQGFDDDGTIHMEVVGDAVEGASQLAFNNLRTPFVNALLQIIVDHAFAAWGLGNFENLHNSTVKFFTDRKSYSKAALSKIRCPVKLIFCLKDVAYDIGYYQVFRRQLKDASVDVELDTVDAAHFGSITRPDVINPMLFDFIAKYTDLELAPIPDNIRSPFEDALIRVGYKGNDSAEGDSDEFF